MKIQNVAGLSHDDLMRELQQGAKFVYFTTAVSVIFATQQKKSPVFMIRPGERSLSKSWPYLLMTALFGWWAFPFGPKYTIRSLRENLKGGIDVTDEVTDTVAGFILFRESERKKAS